MAVSVYLEKPIGTWSEDQPGLYLSRASINELRNLADEFARASRFDDLWDLVTTICEMHAEQQILASKGR